MNLMLGPDPAGKGGIATVVSALIEQGFLRRHGVTYISSHSDGRRAMKLAAGARSFFMVLFHCVFLSPGIVHVHSASRMSFVRKSLFLFVARMFGCKTIFHLHGAEFREFSSFESGILMRWWIRRTLEASSRVIALSDSWKRYLSDYAPRATVRVVPNPVQVAAAGFPCCSREEARILFLGRAETRKGIFDLLDALRLVCAALPNTRLAVAGDGDLAAVRSRAEQLGIARNVEMLGWIGPKEKARELARATVFALPSHNEGLPVAMLEAMAASTAIVATPVGGIPEAIRDGVNGLLVPVGDTAALAEALLKVLGSPPLRDRLGMRARMTVEERFSSEAVIRQLSEIYEELEGAASVNAASMPGPRRQPYRNRGMR